MRLKEYYNFHEFIDDILWTISFIIIWSLFYISFKFLFFPLLKLLRHIYFNSGGAY